MSSPLTFCVESEENRLKNQLGWKRVCEGHERIFVERPFDLLAEIRGKVKLKYNLEHFLGPFGHLGHHLTPLHPPTSLVKNSFVLSYLFRVRNTDHVRYVATS